ncbi:MAG: hypothetical protein K0R54_4925 [Clostridiaceae bacterium]|jgi:biotin carboxyl carrier protein|nr:hypothetical protein [Clostridiaceae bacterium]
MKYNVTVNGKLFEVEVELVKKSYSSLSHSVEREVKPAVQPAAPVEKKAEPKPQQSGKSSNVVCPMPGSIVDVLVKEGQSVKAGDTVVVLEAMKMESEIKCAEAGVVREIKVNKGDHVESGDILIFIG